MNLTYTEIQKTRVDKWLSLRLPEKSREFLNKLIKNGKVLVNNKIVKPSFLLSANDLIEVTDEGLAQETKKELIENKDIKLKIVFENDDFLVIDKPINILVHPTNWNENDTIANALVYLYPEIKSVGEDPIRPGIVHRLDRDTSGLLLVAKNNKTFEILKEKFQNHEIQKTYFALVFGKLKEKQGIIDAAITNSKQKFNRRKVDLKSNGEGKESITEYEVIKEHQNESLLKVMPKTGRTHQIRVHLASISNFVIGDQEYGSQKVNKQYGLNHQFLHAGVLDFDLTGKAYHFESPLPNDLQLVLDRLTTI